MTQTAPAPGTAPAAPIPAGGLSVAEGAARLRAMRQAALTSAATGPLQLVHDSAQALPTPPAPEPPDKPAPAPEPKLADDQAPEPETEKPESPAAEAGDEDYRVELADGSQVPLSELVDAHREAGELRERLARIESGEDASPAVEQARAEIEQQRQAFQAREQKLVEYVQGLRQVEAQAGERMQRYEQALGQLGQVLARGEERWRSWSYERRRAEDPIAAAEELHQYREWEQAQRALEGERQQIEQERQRAMAAEVYRRRQDLELALPSRFPQWSNPEVKKADLEAMNTLGRELGFTDEELTWTFDPRVWQLLHEAAQYRRLRQGREALVNAKPAAAAPQPKPIKVVRPGGAGARGNPQAVAAGRVGGLQQAFNQSRDLTSAAKLLRAQRVMRTASGGR